MSIQIIRQSSITALADAGVPSMPIGPAPKLSGADFTLPEGSAEAGVWECEPGSFRRQVARAEVMHLLEGSCVFQPDEGEPISFGAGDSLYFPENTVGTWEIKTRIRKVYVII
ncbi:cupin domain-containing protein [Ottowia thiooxydans]|uniref:cupin domain-containing protein n=1 Tax=Ottowia thiooxydans TaxID=219182 RepID=UPI000491CAEA|nr:cupin domain-containing protein [Ottowia thiooxydans]